MSADGDPVVHIDRKERTYSYASVADTFFWGERRKYLPSFQAMRTRASESPTVALKTQLHLVSGSQPKNS